MRDRSLNAIRMTFLHGTTHGASNYPQCDEQKKKQTKHQGIVKYMERAIRTMAGL
ncbi:hypothetical protein Pla100_23990 [Neorhodopirellula pilleata]|uniref:Uncharacterized protein n=1 Tax=Neorhodopirellula pilleata TaxID=2714738 RepID=A0A5C6ACC6_9BACT|nr:hypothetical protein Pla100_23990 [Neorhodopirellula pilleata]